MSPSEMSEAMDAVSNMDAASASNASTGSDSPGGYLDYYSLPEYDYEPVTEPVTSGTRSLSFVSPATSLPDALSTPVYGRSGMNEREAVRALSGMGYEGPWFTSNPTQADNTVRTGGGFLADRLGNPVTSTAFPGQLNYQASAPTIPSSTLKAAADLLGMSPEGLLAASGRNEFGEVDPSQLSTTGLDYGVLQAMQNAKLGGLDISPTQTIDQALAAKTAHDYLNEYGPSLFTAGLPPGMAFAFNALRSGADIAAGRTTPGQALLGVGLEAAARAAGLPGGGPMLGDLLEGRVGSAAGRAASGLATGALSRAGLGAFAGPFLKEAGITPAIQKSVSGAVQPQAGQGTGIVSALTNAINRGFQDITGFFGGTPSAPIPATPGVTTPTRAYVPPDSNLYESGGPEPSAAATAPTTPAATTPEVAATRRLLYGTAQGPYGPLLAYDFGEA